jgi:parvulin-like peptidyl-prolyl isomerase
MRPFVRSGLIVSVVFMGATVASAQTPKAGQADAKSAPATKVAAPPRPAILDQVLATVNGEPITRDDLYRFLENAGIPPGASLNDNLEIYNGAIEHITNRKLLNQYYLRQPALAVSEKEVDAEFNAAAEELKKGGEDIYVTLASHGVSVAHIRDEIKEGLRGKKYIDAVATDANLKKFVAENKDVFNRTLVKSSHILVQVDPKATPADKEKAKQKLIAIKREIETNRITFADAANKYSEDESNKTSPQGGDLGYRPRKGITEPYAAAAFAMKVGAISDPIETPFGFHLIQVTDRKEGTPVDFEQNKLLIRREYEVDLQYRIIAQERKTAKIKVEPLPADFFPKTAPPTTPAAPTTPAGGNKPTTPK